MSATSLRVLLLAWSLGLAVGAQAEERFVMTDGRRIAGELGGDRAGGFHFQPSEGGQVLPLIDARRILFDPPARAVESSPIRPFLILLGGRGRLSGRLDQVTRNEIVLRDGSPEQPLHIDRAGVRALAQRPGEALVLLEGFETLESDRWVMTGHPDLVVDQSAVEGQRRLRLSANDGGGTVTFHPVELIDAGRLDLAFELRGENRHHGARAGVELTFRCPEGPKTLRIALGWESDLLTIDPTAANPSLAIQPLLREPGWHRLTVSFHLNQLDVAIDGDELAHGEGYGGPLDAIRLAATSRREIPSADLALFLDDLRLVRFVTGAGPYETDPTQDEIRLVGGDQLFGSIVSATAKQVVYNLDGQPARLDWSRVEGLYFQRRPGTSRLLDGEWVRASWSATPGLRPDQDDSAEGVLELVTPNTIELAVPYVGSLRIPRATFRELVPLGRYRRVVIDTSSYHLGNTIVADLDPPWPGGRVLEVTFNLEAVPDAPAYLALDVVQVVGIEGDLEFSQRVREGELRTRAILNGRAFDTLNQHVTTRNDSPLRIRLPIPPGLLRSGSNRLRFEQEGLKDDPETLDNLGLLGIALEWPSAREATQP